MTDHVDNPFESLATLSICTGIRGLERGVERVIGPLRTIAYAEIEAFIIENLLAGMEAGVLAPAPIWANLKTFPWGQFRGVVDIIVGGYPCPPFSTAGKRLGSADPRHLWPFIEFGIRTVRPVCCFFENVAGHLSLGFEQVAHSLRAMGYAVEAGIYTAEEVGAPHKRARVFILAILADAKDSVRGLYERSRRSGSASVDVVGTGEELANALSDGTGTTPGNSGCQGEENEGEMEREGRKGLFRERSRRHVGNSDTEMGNASILSERKPANQNFPQPTSWKTRDELSSTSEQWPAGPGQLQYSWEATRCLESGVGCTINGYDLREDLLRALGNGVVEQTAELAFRDLMRKHFA